VLCHLRRLAQAIPLEQYLGRLLGGGPLLSKRRQQANFIGAGKPTHGPTHVPVLVEPRPELLATADERISLNRLHQLETALHQSKDPKAAVLQERVERLKGVLTWTLRTEYAQRLTKAHEHLRDLDREVALLKARYDEFVRRRQAATHSYAGYGTSITELRTRVHNALQQVNTLMARQGTLIETVAISELESRGDHLEKYQTQARYAVADSYDRATKARAGGGQP